MEHQRYPTDSTAAVRLTTVHVAEMADSIAAERARRASHRAADGWLRHTVSQALVGLGETMMGLGQQLAEAHRVQPPDEGERDMAPAPS